MLISAYIPCFNNSITVRAVIESIRQQTRTPDELYVVDDGSRDDTVDVVRRSGVEVISMGANLGRGAVRARAMERARGDLVLSVDATNVLPVDFLERALPEFDDTSVAAVFGRIVCRDERSAVQRWRGRHLFNNDLRLPGSRSAVLITYGTLVRSSAVGEVGGYRRDFRHTEDAELGERLRAAGHAVVFQPSLHIESIAENSLWQVLERYWRWHVGTEGTVRLAAYLSQIRYSLRVMAPRDMKQRDWRAAGISLLSPHYSFWKTVKSARSPRPAISQQPAASPAP